MVVVVVIVMARDSQHTVRRHHIVIIVTTIFPYRAVPDTLTAGTTAGGWNVILPVSQQRHVECALPACLSVFAILAGSFSRHASACFLCGFVHENISKSVVVALYR